MVYQQTIQALNTQIKLCSEQVRKILAFMMVLEP